MENIVNLITFNKMATALLTTSEYSEMNLKMWKSALVHHCTNIEANKHSVY